MAVRSGGESLEVSTPSTSLPLMTTCSMSTTLSGNPARTPKRREVTPGRSRPVKVISNVVRSRFIACPRYPLRSGGGQGGVRRGAQAARRVRAARNIHAVEERQLDRARERALDRDRSKRGRQNDPAPGRGDADLPH